MLEKSFGSPLITNDGVTIAKEIELEDHFENMGAKLVSSSFKSKWYRRWRDNYCNCFDPSDRPAKESKTSLQVAQPIGVFVIGIEAAVAAAVGALKNNAIPVANKEAIAQVAAVSSRSEKVGEYIWSYGKS